MRAIFERLSDDHRCPPGAPSGGSSRLTSWRELCQMRVAQDRLVAPKPESVSGPAQGAKGKTEAGHAEQRQAPDIRRASDVSFGVPRWPLAGLRLTPPEWSISAALTAHWSASHNHIESACNLERHWAQRMLTYGGPGQTTGPMPVVAESARQTSPACRASERLHHRADRVRAPDSHDWLEQRREVTTDRAPVYDRVTVMRPPWGHKGAGGR